MVGYRGGWRGRGGVSVFQWKANGAQGDGRAACPARRVRRAGLGGPDQESECRALGDLDVKERRRVAHGVVVPEDSGLSKSGCEFNFHPRLPEIT